MLKLEFEQKPTLEGIAVFELEGALDSDKYPELAESVMNSLDPGVKGVRLDLSKVEQSPKIGLHFIMALYSKLKDKSVSLILAGPNERVLRSLKDCHFELFVRIE